MTDRERALREKANVLAGSPGLTFEGEAEYKTLQEERKARGNKSAINGRDSTALR